MIRTEHRDLIKAIITHPEMYKFICDDGSSNPKDYEPIFSDDIHYLMSDEGIMVFSPINHSTWDIHACILPKWRGKSSKFMKEAVKWMFTNTACKKLEARIPSFNKSAYVQAKHIGFEDEGISKASFMKDGKLYDTNLLGAVCQ